LMTATHFDHGSVCWIDIGVPSPARAAEFYGSLFGWAYTRPDESSYQVAQLRGHQVSGLGPAEDAGLPYWTVVIGVGDIEAAVEAFTTAGATTIEKPSAVSALGRAAIVKDPWGAPVSLWQPGTRTGMQVSREHASFAAVELYTTHTEDTAAFYTEVLGWRHDDRQLTNNGVPVAVLTDAPSPEPTRTGSYWLVHFATDDLANTTDRAIKLGAQHVQTASHSGIMLRDPDGAVFGLTEIK
jgi:predicted enzyme related to lactoylglutathione lyase